MRRRRSQRLNEQFRSCRYVLVRLSLYQPDLDLFDLDRATVLAAVLHRGQPGMHIGGGTLGRLHPALIVGVLVSQHRQHVVERRQARGCNRRLPFCIGFVRNALGSASARTVSASQLSFPLLVVSTFQAVMCSCPHGESSLESTVRYLGIEVDDALAIAEQVEV